MKVHTVTVTVSNVRGVVEGKSGAVQAVGTVGIVEQMVEAVVEAVKRAEEVAVGAVGASV